MKITKSQLKELIKEEIQSLNEAKALFTTKGKRKRDNIVAAIYFKWTKQDNNNTSFWNKVIKIIEGEDCVVLNYVATDSVCEFEFKPEVTGGWDILEDTSNRVEDALATLSSQFTKYDVYVVQ